MRIALTIAAVLLVLGVAIGLTTPERRWVPNDGGTCVLRTDLTAPVPPGQACQ